MVSSNSPAPNKAVRFADFIVMLFLASLALQPSCYAVFVMTVATQVISGRTQTIFLMIEQAKQNSGDLIDLNGTLPSPDVNVSHRCGCGDILAQRLPNIV